MKGIGRKAAIWGGALVLVLVGLLIPTLVPSDTPTEVVDCTLFTDIRSCQAQPVCTWVKSLVRAPYCAHK